MTTQNGQDEFWKNYHAIDSGRKKEILLSIIDEEGPELYGYDLLIPYMQSITKESEFDSHFMFINELKNEYPGFYSNNKSLLEQFNLWMYLIYNSHKLVEPIKTSIKLILEDDITQLESIIFSLLYFERYDIALDIIFKQPNPSILRYVQEYIKHDPFIRDLLIHLYLVNHLVLPKLKQSRGSEHSRKRVTNPKNNKEKVNFDSLGSQDINSYYVNTDPQRIEHQLTKDDFKDEFVKQHFDILKTYFGNDLGKYISQRYWILGVNKHDWNYKTLSAKHTTNWNRNLRLLSYELLHYLYNNCNIDYGKAELFRATILKYWLSTKSVNKAKNHKSTLYPKYNLIKSVVKGRELSYYRLDLIITNLIEVFPQNLQFLIYKDLYDEQHIYKAKSILRKLKNYYSNDVNIKDSPLSSVVNRIIE